MLVALLQPYDLVRQLVPKDRRKEAKARAEAVADGGAAAKAVDDTIKGIQAAVIASTMAAVAASTARVGGQLTPDPRRAGHLVHLRRRGPARGRRRHGRARSWST